MYFFNGNFVIKSISECHTLNLLPQHSFQLFLNELSPGQLIPKVPSCTAHPCHGCVQSSVLCSASFQVIAAKSGSLRKQSRRGGFTSRRRHLMGKWQYCSTEKQHKPDYAG